MCRSNTLREREKQVGSNKRWATPCHDFWPLQGSTPDPVLKPIPNLVADLIPSPTSVRLHICGLVYSTWALEIDRLLMRASDILLQVDGVVNQSDNRSFILSSDHIDSADLQHVDADTRDRLQALLQAAGKLRV